MFIDFLKKKLKKIGLILVTPLRFSLNTPNPNGLKFHSVDDVNTLI